MQGREKKAKMFNFMKKATEKEEKDKRKREKREKKDVKKRDRGSMSAEELLRLDEVRRICFFHEVLLVVGVVLLRSKFLKSFVKNHSSKNKDNVRGHQTRYTFMYLLIFWYYLFPS